MKTMKKNTIKKMPILPISIFQQNRVKEKSNCAALVEMRDDIFIVNLYRKCKVIYRIFCNTEEYTIQQFDENGSFKWLNGQISYHIRIYSLNPVCVRKSDLILMNRFERKCKCQEHESLEDFLYGYEEYIRTKKLKEKHQLEINEIDSMMKHFQKKLPKNYTKFLKNDVFKNHYIFYNKKKKLCTCSKCGTHFAMKDKLYKHNKTFTSCPKCKDKFLDRAEGVSKDCLRSIQWSVIMDKDVDNVYLRYLCHERTFVGTEERFSTSELYRIELRDGHWYYYTYFKNQTYMPPRWCNFHHLYYANKSNWAYTATMYPYATFSDTILKYTGIDLFLKNVCDTKKVGFIIPWFYQTYKKFPYIEKLLKVGFYKLATFVYEYGDYKCIKTTYVVCKGFRRIV